MLRTLAAIAFVTLAQPVVAQTTHVVGAGGFADIPSALAAAVPGDIVVVDAGMYPGFHVNVGVTIRAAVPGSVIVDNFVIIDCPSPQQVHVIGLDVRATVGVNGTMVSFDDCAVTQPSTFGPALRATQAHLTLQNCTVGRGGPPYIAFTASPGLSASNSLVVAADCSIRGLDRDSQFGASASVGVELQDSELHGSFLTIRGGDGFVNGTGGPADGLVATGASTVWLTDSEVSAGLAIDLPNSPPTGCPLTAPAGRLTRTVMTPSTCAPGIPEGAPGISLRRAGPLTSGVGFTLEVRAQPNQLVGVWASLSLGNAAVPALLEQRALLGLATALPFAVMLTDGAGDASGTFPLPAGVEDQTVWFQAVGEGPLPVSLSPVVGGVIR